MKILHEVCSLPTAPFLEERVVAYARAFAKTRKLKLTEDSTGNLLLELPGRSNSARRWVFTAHMDHPGFVSREMIDDRTLACDFRGGVYAEYLKGQKVRFFAGEQEIPGVVVEATAEKDSPVARSAFVRVKRPVPAKCAGMVDQGIARVKGTKFFSRAIDDLGGLAAALEMMDRLARKPPKTHVAVLLTRAEEEGFIGAIAAATKPKLLRKSDLLIAIECSAMQPYAKQGDGCIIRIGDRTSVFNSAISYFITDLASRLAKKDKSFKYQRALMPGGTCEATVYDIYGFTAGSICVPLGNYHNMDRDKKKIGPEYINVNDWKNMVKLFLAIAREGDQFQPGHKQLKAKVEKRYRELKSLL